MAARVEFSTCGIPDRIVAQGEAAVLRYLAWMGHDSGEVVRGKPVQEEKKPSITTPRT